MNTPWPRVHLGTVLRRVDRAEAPVPGKTYRQLGVKLWGEGAYEREPMDGGATRYSGLSRVAADDVVLNKIWARNGSVAVVPPSLAGCYVSSEFPTFVPAPDTLTPRWMHWLTKTPGFWAQCDEKSQGTSGKNRIKPERFLTVEIPLPPLAEQKRIVARIEALGARIREARTLRLQSAQKTEALLYAALRAERNRLSGSPHPKLLLGRATKITSGGTPSRDNLTFWDGEIPWVKTGELLDGDISSTDEHITESGVECSSAKICPVETVLIALYGQGQTRGRTGRLLIPAATNQACCAVLPNPEVFTARYVQFWLRSLYVELREEAKGGAQPNWNGSMIKGLEIVFPPLPEQHRIVSEVDAFQAEMNKLQRLQSETATELRALLPAVLDRAFRGQL